MYISIQCREFKIVFARSIHNNWMQVDAEEYQRD